MKRVLAFAGIAVSFLFVAASEAAAQGKIRVRISSVGKVVLAPDKARLQQMQVGIGPGSTTLDSKGDGVIEIAPGSYSLWVNGPCSLSLVNTSGNISKSGNPLSPMLTFNSTPAGGYMVILHLDCGGTPAHKMAKVKIATTTSCSDRPNEGFSVQGGIAVQLGQNSFTSNDKGVIEADVPIGTHATNAQWKDHTFGFVSINGLKSKPNELGLPKINLVEGTQTLEFRMFTCGADGQAKARAVLTFEIEGGVEIFRDQKTFKGGPGLHLRDGDVVKAMSGKTQLRWLDGNGIITLHPGTLLTIGEKNPGSEVKPKSFKPSAVEILRGIGSFLIPPSEHEPEDYDENGNIIKFKASSNSIAVGVKGTKFTFEHVDETKTSIVSVEEGVVVITPKFRGQQPFQLATGQRATISPSGIQKSEIAQDRYLVTPAKTVFAVGEEILVDFYNAKGRGWDWIVIVDPNRIANASGAHSSIRPEYAHRIDAADQSEKERSGRKAFPALPEGEYEARYVSWDGGNHTTIGRARFKIQRGTTPSAAPPTTAGGGSSGDLSGLWRNPGGNGIYRVRQTASRLQWGIDAVSMGSFANVFEGEVRGSSIEGTWTDLPGSPFLGGGRLFLKVESPCRIVKVSEINHYAAEVWVRKDSPCDVVGLVQKSTPAGSGMASQPTKQNSKPSKPNTAQKPRVEDPDDIIIISDDSYVFGEASKPTAQKKPAVTKPEVLNMPEEREETPPAKATGSNSGQKTPAKNQPKPKEVKPKTGGGSNVDWFGLGKAIGDAIKGNTNTQPTNPRAQTGISTNNVPACRGGAYALGAAQPQAWKIGTPGEGIRIWFSTPMNTNGSLVRVFQAGTNQQVTWGYNPLHKDFCGLTWPFYFYTPGYFDAYLYVDDKSSTPIAGPTRFQVYQ